MATRVTTVEAKLAGSETGFRKALYAIAGRPGIYRRVSANAAKTTEVVKAWYEDEGPLPFRRWVEAEKVFGLVAAPAEEDARTEYEHGQCAKMPHEGSICYSHSEEDDTPYEVNGLNYCGRCHAPM